METKDISIFKNKRVILDENLYLKGVSELIIDEPYLDTKMKLLIENEYFFVDINLKKYGIIEKKLISNVYDKLQNKDIFIEFMKKLGIIYKLNIEEVTLTFDNKYLKQDKDFIGTKEREKTKIDKDYKIDNLIFLLKKQKIDISLFIWDIVRKADKKVLIAKYSPNRQYPPKTTDSFLIKTLKKYAWIPDKNGNFYKPKDIDSEMLPKEFVLDNRNGWLDSIGFEEEIKKQKDEYKIKQRLAENIGIDIEVLELMKNFPKDKLTNLANELKQKEEKLSGAEQVKSYNKKVKDKKEKIEPINIKDIERFEKETKLELEKVLNESKIIKKSYQSTIKTGEKDIRELLHNYYKGYCQICGFTFSTKNGNYFERFSWSDTKRVSSNINFIEIGGSLSLCSRCHSIIKGGGDFWAEFLEDELFNKLKDKNYSFDKFINDTKIENILNIPEIFEGHIEFEDMYSLPIRLNNKHRHLYFTEEHILRFFFFLKS